MGYNEGRKEKGKEGREEDRKESEDIMGEKGKDFGRCNEKAYIGRKTYRAQRRNA